MGRRLTLGVLLLVVSACGQGSAGAGGGRVTSGVAGRTFLSVQVTADGKDRPLVEGSRIRLDFSTDGRIGIQAGCNSMGGGYRLDGGRLTLTEGLVQTDMGCSAPLMQQDTWLAGLFTAGATLELTNDVLVLTSGSTRIELLDREVAVSDADLWETRWLMDGVDDGRTASSVAAGTSPSIRLRQGPPSRVEVQTGCNGGSGPVSAADDAATFGPVAVTRRGCADPAATAVEQAMLGVLQGDGPVAYRIEGDVLTLSRGSTTLTFRAQPSVNTTTVRPTASS